MIFLSEYLRLIEHGVKSDKSELLDTYFHKILTEIIQDPEELLLKVRVDNSNVKRHTHLNEVLVHPRL